MKKMCKISFETLAETGRILMVSDFYDIPIAYSLRNVEKWVKENILSPDDPVCKHPDVKSYLPAIVTTVWMKTIDGIEFFFVERITEGKKFETAIYRMAR